MESSKQKEKLLEVPVNKQGEKLPEILGNKQTEKPQVTAARKKGMGIGANTKPTGASITPGPSCTPPYPSPPPYPEVSNVLEAEDNLEIAQALYSTIQDTHDVINIV